MGALAVVGVLAGVGALWYWGYYIFATLAFLLIASGAALLVASVGVWAFDSVAAAYPIGLWALGLCVAGGAVEVVNETVGRVSR